MSYTHFHDLFPLSPTTTLCERVVSSTSDSCSPAPWWPAMKRRLPDAAAVGLALGTFPKAHRKIVLSFGHAPLLPLMVMLDFGFCF